MADLPDFDKLWNYQDAAATETKFRELLPATERSGEGSYRAQLLTQIARTQGLQDRFDDAHATLDSVEKMLTDDQKLARVRYLLERGRVFNSAGQHAKAMPLFEASRKLAEAEKFPSYAVDAVHMLAIAAPTTKEQIEWNLRGIERLEREGKRDGWISEEHAECLLAAGHADEATPHFKVAYDLLKSDSWLLKNEPAKLERLRRLAGER